VGEQAFEIDVYRATLARVITFFGSVLATTRFVYSTKLIRFFVVGAVQGLHCVHLSASTVYDYIEHTQEMSCVNGSTDALSIGPSAGYNMFFVFIHVLLLFTAYASSHTHMHIHHTDFLD
jgi:hypothetical protein